MQGDSLNVMSNRTKISALSKIFQEIDYFYLTIMLKMKHCWILIYELKDFPINNCF